MKRKKINFDRIWELIQQFDATLGLFLFRDSSKKKTRLEWFFSGTIPTQLTLLTVFIVSTLIITRFQLINVIFGALVIIVNIGAYSALSKMCRNRNILKDLFDWCRGLYEIGEKFHPVVQKEFESRLFTMEKQVFRGLKWLRMAFYADAVSVTLGYVLIGQVLPESIVPKFGLPLPFCLPFKEQENLVAFLTTIVAQTIFVVHCGTIFIFIAGIFFCIVVHIIGMLDLVLEAVGKMKLELMSLNGFDDDEGHRRPKLQMKVLAEINQSTSNKISFPEWMKILNDMISDVNSVISSLGGLYTEYFLSTEIMSLATLFICGLIFTVIKQQYFFAVGVTIMNLMLFIICYVNEKILDKFSDIKEALYDLPWYGLDVKEQKMLMILMNCDEIQKGFTAAGFNGLTMERFAIIARAGYNNVLVLKNIVEM